MKTCPNFVSIWCVPESCPHVPCADCYVGQRGCQICIYRADCPDLEIGERSGSDDDQKVH